MRITLPDALIVVGYFLATIGLGLWFGRKKVTTDEQLFLAGREATWPLIGASLFSANISSRQFVGQAGLAYSIGLAAGAFQMVGAMCFVFLAVLFIDVYLGLKLLTAPEFFERRYNTSCRILVSGINVVMILAANITTALYAGSTVLGDLLGWQGENALLAGIVVMALSGGTYTILGGLRSVLWVDLLQATTLVGGGAIVFFMYIARAGGVDAALEFTMRMDAACGRCSSLGITPSAGCRWRPGRLCWASTATARIKTTCSVRWRAKRISCQDGRRVCRRSEGRGPVHHCRAGRSGHGPAAGHVRSLSSR